MVLNTNPVWAMLQLLADQYQAGFDLRSASSFQPLDRLSALCLDAPYLHVDTTKQSWNPEVLHALCTAAEQMNLPKRRARLLTGKTVNPTEKRSAVHALWRKQSVSGSAATPVSLKAMLTLAEQVRGRADIDDVVHIGIGGSSLGPEMALQALKPFTSARQRIHVVSNLDGHDLHQTLQGLNPRRTLFIVVSKSWSTTETLRNAESAIAWLRQGGVRDVGAQIVAVSSKPDLAQRMGAGAVLDMPEGMGGRFSLWSAVGLPLAVALGQRALWNFRKAEQKWTTISPMRLYPRTCLFS